MKSHNFRIFLFISGALLLISNVYAQTDIYIRGAGKLFPIALPQLCLQQSGATSAQIEIPKIMARNLALSGYFQVLEANTYIETPGKCGGPEAFAYSDWSVIGAEGLVRGTVDASPEGLKVKLYLYDVAKQHLVLGKEYVGDESQVPTMAHRFANEIMKFFTGEAGVFGSQIAFSSRVGRFKELFVMDMDGSNVRQLTSDRSLNVSTGWRPSGDALLFTSYRQRVPDLFRIDINSRKSVQLTKNSELELGAKYSPDGQSIALAVTSPRGGSDISIISPEGTSLRKLSRGNGVIDVSPRWSPDGNSIAFCSNRSGGPQIYVMDRDGSNPRRISFVSANYCTSPAWSPKGDRIAFVCRSDGGFNIFVSDKDGGNPLQITSVADNEDPDWSPNGLYLVFSTTYWRKSIYSLALMRSDGSSMKQLTQSRSGDFQPAWGPVP